MDVRKVTRATLAALLALDQKWGEEKRTPKYEEVLETLLELAAQNVSRCESGGIMVERDKEFPELAFYVKVN